jgi:hypothetical protein
MKDLMKNKYDTYRDLEKVFAADFIRDLTTGKPKYGYKNTILLDSSSEKLQKHLENSLIVPPFEEKDLLLNLDE